MSFRYEEIAMVMKPGRRYTAAELARELDWPSANVSHALSAAFVHRLVERDTRSSPCVWIKIR